MGSGPNHRTIDDDVDTLDVDASAPNVGGHEDAVLEILRARNGGGGRSAQRQCRERVFPAK